MRRGKYTRVTRRRFETSVSPHCVDITEANYVLNRPFAPFTAARQAVAIVEQRAHICLLELLLVLDVEVLADEGEVVVDAVFLRDQINAVEVADPLGVDQRGNRAPDDA